MTIETDENLEDVVRGAVITECESAGIDIYHRGDRYSSITVAQSEPTTYEASINVSGRILFDDLFAEQGSLLGINDGIAVSLKGIVDDRLLLSVDIDPHSE